MSAMQPAASPASNFVVAMSERFGIDYHELHETLAKTAFRQKGGGRPSDAQMTALMIVANEYNLNPFTKEIYAFPDKSGGIIPVVGVDGWISIINARKEYQGIEFIYSDRYVTMKGTNVPCPDWIECWITRSDLAKPVKVREFLDETYRLPNGFGGPWQTHPKRMLRHKALVQCARVAFGLSGIYDEDEAARIFDAHGDAAVTSSGASLEALPSTSQERLSPQQLSHVEQTCQELIRQCREKGSFAPGKAWVATQTDPVVQAYLSGAMKEAEAEWLQEAQTNTVSADAGSVESDSAEEVHASVNDVRHSQEELDEALKELINACRKRTSYQLGYQWVAKKLTHEADIEYVTNALKEAEAEDQRIQSAA